MLRFGRVMKNVVTNKSNNNAMCWSLCRYSQAPPSEEASPKEESQRMQEFRKKLREKTPIDDLGEQPVTAKEDPLPPWPDNINPHTGEIGGPRGPEPTRYGDWERKGRTIDF